jgi:hypothetical protein
MYCYAIIQQSRIPISKQTPSATTSLSATTPSIDISSAPSSQKHSQLSNEEAANQVDESVRSDMEYLEAFFPFDPCHLIMSKNVIDEFYLFWREDADADPDVDEEEENENGLAIPRNSVEDNLASSIDLMSL